MTKITVELFTEPVSATAEKMADLALKLGTDKRPFGGFQIQPGVGTFESYVEFGAMNGASADGRLRGETFASDLSPSPSPVDKPVNHQTQPMTAVLNGYAGDGTAGFWSGAPTDLNIAEDYPLDALTQNLRDFANGSGSNVLTVTCANPETFEDAKTHPEKYDLLRVRMGGWTEFFTAMYPEHQHQHQRRPLHTPLQSDK